MRNPSTASRVAKGEARPKNDWPNPLPAYFASHPHDTRALFAQRAGVSIDTLRSWSQWKRRPELDGRRACERASFGAIPCSLWLYPGERDEDGNIGAANRTASPTAA